MFRIFLVVSNSNCFVQPSHSVNTSWVYAIDVFLEMHFHSFDWYAWRWVGSTGWSFTRGRWPTNTRYAAYTSLRTIRHSPKAERTKYTQPILRYWLFIYCSCCCCCCCCCCWSFDAEDDHVFTLPVFVSFCTCIWYLLTYPKLVADFRSCARHIICLFVYATSFLCSKKASAHFLGSPYPFMQR